MGRIKEWLEDLAEDFNPELICCVESGKRRFNSIISIIFHKILSKWFIAMLLLYLVEAVISLIMKKGIIQIVLGGAILAVLATVAIFIFFIILMIFEAYAKQITSLLIFGKLSDETYNPIDEAIYSFLSGSK